MCFRVVPFDGTILFRLGPSRLRRGCLPFSNVPALWFRRPTCPLGEYLLICTCEPPPCLPCFLPFFGFQICFLIVPTSYFWLFSDYYHRLYIILSRDHIEELVVPQHSRLALNFSTVWMECFFFARRLPSTWCCTLPSPIISLCNRRKTIQGYLKWVCPKHNFQIYHVLLLLIELYYSLLFIELRPLLLYTIELLYLLVFGSSLNKSSPTLKYYSVQ